VSAIYIADDVGEDAVEAMEIDDGQVLSKPVNLHHSFSDTCMSMKDNHGGEFFAMNHLGQCEHIISSTPIHLNQQNSDFLRLKSKPQAQTQTQSPTSSSKNQTLQSKKISKNQIKVPLLVIMR
jgi:hypothetical protein